jgi:hypothetical protein
LRGGEFRRDSVIASIDDETIPFGREMLRKQIASMVCDNRTERQDHVGIDPEPRLPRIPQTCPCRHDDAGRKTLIEVVTALLIFVSIDVFLAHAFDAFRLR